MSESKKEPQLCPFNTLQPCVQEKCAIFISVKDMVKNIEITQMCGVVLLMQLIQQLIQSLTASLQNMVSHDFNVLKNRLKL